jgi:hypothetical protein
MRQKKSTRQKKSADFFSMISMVYEAILYICSLRKHAFIYNNYVFTEKKYILKKCKVLCYA